MTDTEVLDVVGSVEAADLLSVEPQRISRWLRQGKLPPPYSRPLISPVWMRADIERFRDNGMKLDGVTFTVPPRTMPLLATNEVAALLGVGKSQIGRWRRQPPQRTPRLPEPAAKITAGLLWDRQDILRFARARRKA